jgi:hypothetical protein
MPSKFKWSHLCQNLSKNKAKRVEEVVLMHVWVSGIKTLPRHKLMVLGRAFYSNRDTVATSTGPRHDL